MAATAENPIVFYDIVGKDGTSWTPNPYKTRLNLCYKGLPFRTEWVKIENVEPLMKEMGIPPTSKTFPYYTLPMIADPSSDPNGKPTYVSESFKIAEYLDEKYPAPKYPIVLPTDTHALQKISAQQYSPSLVSAPLAVIVSGIPNALDEGSKEYMYKSRGGKDKFNVASEEVATKAIADTREKWDTFALALGEGPWIMGDTVTFADFVVGAGFYFWRKTTGSEGKLWKETAEWQNGRWGDYWKRIEEIEKRSPGSV